jgi:hypothetical protein
MANEEEVGRQLARQDRRESVSRLAYFEVTTDFAPNVQDKI